MGTKALKEATPEAKGAAEQRSVPSHELIRFVREQGEVARSLDGNG